MKLLSYTPLTYRFANKLYDDVTMIVNVIVIKFHELSTFKVVLEVCTVFG